MGIFDNIKKGAKSYAVAYKKSSAEKRKYKEKLQSAVQKARRESYKTEAVKSARVKAKIDAQRRFNPSTQVRAIGGGMTAEA